MNRMTVKERNLYKAMNQMKWVIIGPNLSCIAIAKKLSQASFTFTRIIMYNNKIIYSYLVILTQEMLLDSPNHRRPTSKSVQSLCSKQISVSALEIVCDLWLVILCNYQMPMGMTEYNFGHKLRTQSLSTTSLPATLHSVVSKVASCMYLLICLFIQTLLMLQ